MKPKFTWGDTVVLIGSGRSGAICAMTETDTGFVYTIEFGDGSDALIHEDELERVPTPDS